MIHRMIELVTLGMVLLFVVQLWLAKGSVGHIRRGFFISVIGNFVLAVLVLVLFALEEVVWSGLLGLHIAIAASYIFASSKMTWLGYQMSKGCPAAHGLWVKVTLALFLLTVGSAFVAVRYGKPEQSKIASPAINASPPSTKTVGGRFSFVLV